ncbi:MAG: aminomethyl-transferring glycine dehydrogenase subunit GcvPB [Firmicutes bacterium]|nr:aminomethyl-transferring glycine dehydrogenase subunit GcvPB [Bacillota bacterium]
MSRSTEPLIFELSSPGRLGVDLPRCDVPSVDPGKAIGQNLVSSTGPDLPELSEIDVIRHFTRLSKRNIGVDTSFYPLGSCTMKYNPKVNEDLASLPGFASVHPLQPADDAQGTLRLLYELEQFLVEIGGMDAASLQPAAGAQGEMTGLMLIRAYHMANGDSARRKILVPDSSHGTNPASAALTGFEVVEVMSNDRGGVDLEDLKRLTDETVAGLMLTNPNTLGLFDENIEEIVKIVHNAGGLAYYDGANMNAILGICRPGDMGFDVMHFNLHKTFSTPHGGGGPGSGPVAVKKHLTRFLPKPRVRKDSDGRYYLDNDCPDSIGKVRSFCGNVGVCIKAYCYIRQMGAAGLTEVSKNAVLNANYLLSRLKGTYDLPYDRTCMHEFVLSAENLKSSGVKARDVAKRLLDYGVHPPTVYFPLIVHEALMVEPTETETIETLDAFADAMIAIARESESDKEKVLGAPHETVVGRLDEVLAARKPDLRWKPRAGAAAE